jgi:hypothetical protein
MPLQTAIAPSRTCRGRQKHRPRLHTMPESSPIFHNLPVLLLLSQPSSIVLGWARVTHPNETLALPFLAIPPGTCEPSGPLAVLTERCSVARGGRRGSEITEGPVAGSLQRWRVLICGMAEVGVAVSRCLVAERRQGSQGAGNGAVRTWGCLNNEQVLLFGSGKQHNNS